MPLIDLQEKINLPRRWILCGLVAVLISGYFMDRWFGGDAWFDNFQSVVVSALGAGFMVFGLVEAVRDPLPGARRSLERNGDDALVGLLRLRAELLFGTSFVALQAGGEAMERVEMDEPTQAGLRFAVGSTLIVGAALCEVARRRRRTALVAIGAPLPTEKNISDWRFWTQVAGMWAIGVAVLLAWDFLD